MTRTARNQKAPTVNRCATIGWWVFVAGFFLALAGGPQGALAEQSCPSGLCPLEPPAIGRPHPAVVRVRNADARQSASLGSGAIVQVAAGQGLVLTCAHLFRDGVGQVAVTLHNGRAVRGDLVAVDQPADLAALSIPLADEASIEPTPVAQQFSRQGEASEVCGYGPDGQYRCVTGRVLGYTRMQGAPAAQVMVVSGAARNGDSGGPILNDRGEVSAVLWGTDRSETYGTCCLRIRQFLGQLPGRWGQRENPGRPAPPHVARNLPMVQPPSISPPATAPKPDRALVERIEKLENELAENNSARADRQSSAAAAESWLSTKAIALLAAVGVPGWAAALGLWIVKRRLHARLAGRRDASPDVQRGAGGRLQQRAASAAYPDFAEPIVVRSDTAPGPQIVERSREFVPIQIPSNRLKALEWAMDEIVRRNPGMRTAVETVEAYAGQYESGLKKNN